MWYYIYAINIADARKTERRIQNDCTVYFWSITPRRRPSALFIYNLDHNISFKRCDKYYEYEYKGLKHLYFPDFELSDGTIIEIKGYHTDIVDIKSGSVKDRPIKVLYKKDLLEYFKYVCSSYNVKESEIYMLYDKLY